MRDMVGYAETELHEGCAQEYSPDDWKCLLPKYSAKFLQTPIFVMNSQYDTSELHYNLALSDQCYNSLAACTEAELEAIELLPVMHEEAMAPLLAKNTTGAFLPNDFSNRVVGLWAWKINGTTWVDALDRWLQGEHVILKDPRLNLSSCIPSLSMRMNI